MAKIGKIRIINFTYNDNRHIYDETFDFYNGENTLLNLQNGGGKTVLVQMMLQPIVPKQKLKDRPLKNYFKNSKAPVYIMIEWILDGSSKRVMTGIGIKKIISQREGTDKENIKVITFISEYEKESDFDINNIELLQEERGIVKLIDFEKVIRDLSNAEKEGENVWLFRWNLPDDKKEYSKRLLSYKINQSEWKNLMVKINESEAGLTSFFNDCKTTSSLIKKWFIPTIEEQLNRNGNSIENIKELIKNHAEQIVKNESMIREREIFESFKEKSSNLLEKLKEYKDIMDRLEDNKYQLGNAYIFVNQSIKEFHVKREELLESIKNIEEHIKELEYQKISLEYHKIEGFLKELKDDLEGFDIEIDNLKKQMDDLEYKRKQLLCVKVDGELKNINKKIAKFETELQKENLQQEDVKNIIEDIEYSLKEKYREKIVNLENTIGEGKKELSFERDKLLENNKEKEQINKKISSLNDYIISVRGRIAHFNEKEASLKEAYPDFDVGKNIENGQYTDYSLEAVRKGLLEEEENIEEKILCEKEKQVKIREKTEELEKEFKKLKDKEPELLIEKNKKQSEYSLFEDEKKVIEKIIKSCELGEECLFDREKILLSLNMEREKYQKLVNDKNLENSIYKKQLNLYQSGKVFEFSEELKKIFEDKNIFVEFGYEWLRDIKDNKNKKLKLVKDNPFLPYAIIVSKKDIEMIKEIEFKTSLSSVIPIIEREKLEIELNVESRNNYHSIDGVDFIIPFDDRTLNKKYLNEICDDILFKIEKNNEILKNAGEALKNIEINILKTENFSYTEAGVKRLCDDIESITKNIDEIKAKIEVLEDEFISLNKQKEGFQVLSSELEREKSEFLRKKQDIFRFLENCQSYSNDLKEKSEKEDDLREIKTSLDTLEREIIKSNEKINDKDMKISNMSGELEKEKLEYQKYSHVQKGKFIDESIETLESKLSAYTSKISGKIQNLKDILEDYRIQRDEKQKTILNLKIEEHLYKGMEFSQFEYEKVEREAEKVNKSLNSLMEKKNDIKFKIAERNSDLKYIKRNIEEKCGYNEPKDKEYIREMDFEHEKKMYRKKLKELEKNISLLKADENNLQKVRFGLEEYSIFANKVEEHRVIEGDINSYVLNLIRDFKRTTELTVDMKNLLTTLYNDLEGEFTIKAEMFKNLFSSILDGERRYKPVHSLNALERVYLQIDRKIQQHAIDLGKIDSMETCIIDNTLSYLKNVYDEMKDIDKNSTIDIEGRRSKMLIITLPEKDELETLSLKEYLKHTIMNCVELCKEGKAMDGLLTNEISTYHLFDRFVSINKIGITLIKIEPNRLKKKTWRQVIEENSGGELFVSAFVVFISLLTYMRGENLLGANLESKVLIMDNPFGPLTSEHLLKPLFEIAKKYNTQFICLSDLKEQTVIDRFNLIYSLNIEREVGREDEYIEIKTIKKDVVEEDDEVLSASMFKIEDKSRFELAN
ncbi:hypothetical protein RBH29_01250 [Herbivorax sp. ANBcel31]|uniref:hypothetical protein n=1 Tax=Herbivorax sp. ANBcel31 TaxID=3069754 RepID=UPI0027B3FF1E|nr:hypothetical protein [Herbivorax sp. ANBcel31]MDQ2085064.1 hypothetical protein [Herbivorax sp. ANBcel31]